LLLAATGAGFGMTVVDAAGGFGGAVLPLVCALVPVAMNNAAPANGAITIADFQSEVRAHSALPDCSPMIRLLTNYPDVSIPSVVVVNRQKVQSRCNEIYGALIASV
jgi:hypothetical protein